jgi:hypothetical protein
LISQSIIVSNNKLTDTENYQSVGCQTHYDVTNKINNVSC